MPKYHVRGKATADGKPRYLRARGARAVFVASVRDGPSEFVSEEAARTAIANYASLKGLALTVEKVKNGGR